ncbi:MAG TPA: hypothetical protein PK490_06105 [Prosthecobacter sp.]|nr:hypothetical protein [Prosthecobacter sp.]HRK13841.1 hypothetical protein [Prosthecobacter sp.]
MQRQHPQAANKKPDHGTSLPVQTKAELPGTAFGSAKPGIVFIQTAAKSMIPAAKSICLKAVCMKMTAESILPAIKGIKTAAKGIKTAIKGILLKAKGIWLIVNQILLASIFTLQAIN